MSDVTVAGTVPPAVTQPLRRVYILYGDDDLGKDDTLAAIRAAAGDTSFADFDWEVLDAAAVEPADILASASAVPFGSPRRTVVVRSAEVYRRKERQRDAERMAAGIAGLGSTSCLVLVAGADTGQDRAKGKAALTTRLDAAVRVVGLVVQHKPLGGEALADWLRAVARAEGKDLRPDAAARLIEAVHTDRRGLRAELDKAVCYVGDRAIITPADVDAVCSFDPEDVMFRLVDAVGARQADRALVLLQELLRYDNRAPAVVARLLAMLDRQLRLVWQARMLMDQGYDSRVVRSLPADVAAELPNDASVVAMAWKARDLFAAARRWDAQSLVQAWSAVVECDMANKGGGEGSDDVVLNAETLIVRLTTGGLR